MTTNRRFVCDDLLRFNNVNLDVFTETVRVPLAVKLSSVAVAPAFHALTRAPTQYGLPFYLQYLARWPEYFLFSEGPGGACQGYSAWPAPRRVAVSTARGAGKPDTDAALRCSHGQSGGPRRELARPRDRRHGACCTTLMRQPHTLKPGASLTPPSRWLPNTAAKAWRRS